MLLWATPPKGRLCRKELGWRSQAHRSLQKSHWFSPLRQGEDTGKGMPRPHSAWHPGSWDLQAQTLTLPQEALVRKSRGECHQVLSREHGLQQRKSLVQQEAPPRAGWGVWGSTVRGAHAMSDPILPSPAPARLSFSILLPSQPTKGGTLEAPSWKRSHTPGSQRSNHSGSRVSPC